MPHFLIIISHFISFNQHHPFLCKYLFLWSNKLVLNWTLCQLLCWKLELLDCPAVCSEVRPPDCLTVRQKFQSYRSWRKTQLHENSFCRLKTKKYGTFLLCLLFTLRLLRCHDIMNKDTQQNDIQHNDTQQSDIQHNNKLNTTLSITMLRVLLCWASFVLSVIYAECRKQAHYAECRYAECRGAALKLY